jgi:hypothetical protein
MILARRKERLQKDIWRAVISQSRRVLRQIVTGDIITVRAVYGDAESAIALSLAKNDLETALNAVDVIWVDEDADDWGNDIGKR